MNMQRMASSLASPSGAQSRKFLLSPLILPGLLRFADVAAIAACGVLSHAFAGPLAGAAANFQLVCSAFIILTFLSLASIVSLYRNDAIMRPLSRSDDMLIAIVTAFLLFTSAALALQVHGGASGLRWMFTFMALSAVGVVGVRLLLCWALQRLSRRGLIGRNLAILGAGEQSQRLLRRFRKTQPYFTSTLGFFAADDEDGPDVIEGYARLGDIPRLMRYARDGAVDDVVVALPWNADRKLLRTIETLRELPVNVYLSTDLAGFELAFRPVMGSFREVPMFEITQRPISGWSQALKLLEDYVIASVLLVLLSPLMAVIALAIRLDSPGPVFFKQKRIGFNNHEFDVYKFRSMYHRPEPERVVVQAQRRDPRVTRVGAFIRATSLDEVPQLFNVLNGTMSLVGPRPHALSHNEEYGRQIRGYFARHRVKPGITGWAQVNGLRGETETLDKMEARVSHDIYYADNWSLLFDLRILIATAFVVLFQKSAY